MNLKHGMSKVGNVHPLYRLWCDIKARCKYPSSTSYKYCGARGITVCKEWQNDSAEFMKWAIDNGWEEGLQIDRRDNDGNYSPENCRFVTAVVNANNRRLLMENNTSGYRGVTWHKQKNKWYVSITGNGKKQRYLGSFNSRRLAALRYDVEAFLLNDGRPMNFIERAT